MDSQTCEMEQNNTDLQADKILQTAAVTSIVEKPSDPDLKVLSGGTLKTLDRQNQVFNLWNTELESKIHEVGSLAETDEGERCKRITKQEGIVVISSTHREISELRTPPPLQTEMAAQKNDLQIPAKNVKPHEMQDYLTREKNVMEDLIQDLKANVTSLQEEKQGLQANLEELDKQHQDALDQLLHLRKAEQIEKDLLRSQLEDLKKTQRTELREFSDAEVLTSLVVLADAETQTELFVSQEELLLKQRKELCEKMRKMINFDLSYEDETSDPLHILNQVVNLCNEWKWKKDTLERKFTELMRENGNAKDTITVLEEECSSLRENIEQLAEQLVGINKTGKQCLPTIHENSEEAEAMEQKVTLLEAQVEVLNETRASLEADASKMSERCQELQSTVKSLDTQLRNQGNIEEEIVDLQVSFIALKDELQEVYALKAAFQKEVECLQLRLNEYKNDVGKVEKDCMIASGNVDDVGKDEDLRCGNIPLEHVECLQQAPKSIEDTTHVCEAQIDTSKMELGSSSSQVKQAESLSIDLELNQSNNFSLLPNYEDIIKRLEEVISLCHMLEMADVKQNLEKCGTISEGTCVHAFSGIIKSLQEECIGMKSDMLKQESERKEVEKWREDVEIAKKDLQLLCKEREALRLENNRLNISNISFQKQIEILQGNVLMLENANSKQSSQGTEIMMDQTILHEKEKTDGTNRTNLALIDDCIVQKPEEENQKPLKLVEETRQIELLNSEIKYFKGIIQENLVTISELEQAKAKLTDQVSGNEEKLEMMKDTISRLSNMIREKEKEYFEERERERLEVIAAHESAAQAINERDQLVETVQVKHQESLQYHAEIQRLTAVLTQEMQKYEKTVMQYTTMVQRLEEQKNAVEVSEEIQRQQFLVAERDEMLQECSKQLHVKESELQACHIELEALREQVDSVAQRGKPDGGVDDQEKVDLQQAKEASLQREVERLRLHLIEIEEMHTREALHLEESIKDLQNKLQQAEEHVKSSSVLYKSASIRSNQQVETLQQQARLIAQQRDEVQGKLSVAEDQVAKHSAALCNLQAVLEQFQRDKERELVMATSVVCSEVEAAQARHNDLLAEIASLKVQLNEAKEGLGAAARLGEQLEKKATVNAALKKEVADLQEKLKKAENDSQSVSNVTEGKIDKSLAKNLVLGYFFAPPNSKEQVLHIVSSVLDFSDVERKQVQHKLGFHDPGTPSGGWFKNFLPLSGNNDGSKQSFAEEFVRFLESESVPHPKLRMLPDAEQQSSSSASSNSASPSGSQSKSSLLLPDVQLPTFMNVGRSSSTILKDILKES